MYHYINRITASECDFVLTGCPLSVLKFQELGYNSFFLPVESDGTIFKNYGEKKKHDVLFFGRVKNNRSEITKYLKEKIQNNIKEPNLLEYLDLVSLGTVCDVVPLTGLNRAIVKQGLKIMRTKKNLGLKTLIDICNIV